MKLVLDNGEVYEFRDWDAVAHKLPYTDWFLKVIDQWLFFEDDGDPDDCLAVFYEFEARNA